MKKIIAVLMILSGLKTVAQVTPNISLNLPSPATQNWNVPLNQNFTILDGYLGGVTQFPHALKTDITGSPAKLGGISFCTGFTPTNGQNVQLTTASSPNPCWTAAASGGGSIGGSVDSGYMPIAVSANTLGNGPIDYGVTIPDGLTMQNAGPGGTSSPTPAAAASPSSTIRLAAVPVCCSRAAAGCS